ncbi:hypothetical protein BRARA_H00610 [Brassica rapa]|uniref:Uncharacterized protein n=1 Tax=Brassica campestris TaxID=3711 RepID=A0A397YAC0_BRACM|nr:hypothetical protein BRARA_H00610 [Brassica rapa]
MQSCQIVVSAYAFGGEITLTNLLECLRHQLKRFATYRFGMSYTCKAGSRVIRLARLSFDKFLDNIISFIKAKATNIHKP